MPFVANLSSSFTRHNNTGCLTKQAGTTTDLKPRSNPVYSRSMTDICLSLHIQSFHSACREFRTQDHNWTYCCSYFHLDLSRTDNPPSLGIPISNKPTVIPTSSSASSYIRAWASLSQGRIYHLKILNHSLDTVIKITMGVCAHSFRIIKSDSTLVQWVCWMCQSGPHWWVFECRYCKIHTCRACVQVV